MKQRDGSTIQTLMSKNNRRILFRSNVFFPNTDVQSSQPHVDKRTQTRASYKRTPMEK
jgi:hypothetical protein